MKARIFTGFAAMALLCVGVSPASGQLAPALAYAWSLNLEAFNREDVDAAMATVDTRSPDYNATKKSLEAQFEAYDLQATVVKFDLIGHDDEFAVARVKTKTTGKPGSGFVDNVVDAVVLFHQQGGVWKLWSEEIVAVEIGS